MQKKTQIFTNHIATKADLESTNVENGIRKGIVFDSKVQQHKERDCFIPCCNIL